MAIPRLTINEMREFYPVALERWKKLGLREWLYFIARARKDIPILLAELERERGELRARPSLIVRAEAERGLLYAESCKTMGFGTCSADTFADNFRRILEAVE